MPDQDQVDQMLIHWQSALNLEAWRIKIKYVEGLSIPNALMQVTPTRNRQMACISIKNKCLAIENEEFELLLVHELVHLIYDPLAEEHSIQIQFVDGDGTRGDEYKMRFIRALEKAVEHTTMILAPLRLFNSDDSVISKRMIPLLSDDTMSVEITVSED